jgi:hypothetical protein
VAAAAALLALAADGAFVATYLSEGDLAEPRPLLVVVSLAVAGLLLPARRGAPLGFALVTIGSWMLLGAMTLGLLLLPAFVLGLIAARPSDNLSLAGGAAAGLALVVLGIAFTP